MKRSYIVCATPRSGSTLLCQLLASTGVAGRPEEYFEARPDTGRPPHPGEYLRGLPRTGAGIRDNTEPPEGPEYSSLDGIEDYREHLDRSFRLGTTANGVFGTKLMWRNLPDLHELASQLDEYRELDAHVLLERLFEDPRYVWMTRRDKTRQAISLWRALQTRTWRAEHPDRKDVDEDDLHYSYDGIEHLRRSLAEDDGSWQAFLESHGRRVVTVVYEEDLERDQRGTVERVLEHLGVTLPDGWEVPTRTYRQADELTERWVAEHAAEHDRRSQLV